MYIYIVLRFVVDSFIIIKYITCIYFVIVIIIKAFIKNLNHFKVNVFK